jgi:hypothetical protein
MRLAASRSLSMLVSVYQLGTNSTLAQDKPQAVAGESPSNQQPSLAEKIRDVSPDKKFAMRISYDAELNKQVTKAEKADPEKIFSQTIKAIELVSLPDKSVVANFFWRTNSSAVNMTSSCWFGRQTPTGARSMRVLRGSDTRRFINGAAASLTC